MRHIAIFLLAACLPHIALQPARAQQFNDPLGSSDRYSKGLIGQFDPSADIAVESATVSAQIAPATDARPAALLIKAKIAPGRHTYSITQPPGGPLPTRIELDPSGEYRRLGPFRAYPAPHTRVEEGPVWTGLEVQEHEGEVIWYAPIEVAAGGDPATLNITGDIHLSVCQTGGYCEPVDKSFSAKLAENVKLPEGVKDDLAHSTVQIPQSETTYTGTFQAKDSVVKLTGKVVPAAVRPGGSAKLEFTATLPKGSRVYARADRDDKLGTKPVLIAVDRASGLIPHRPSTDAPVKTDVSVPQFGDMKYHEGAVTWTIRVDVPKDATPGEYPITGMLGYQACEYGDDGKNVCELPRAVHFAADLNVASEAGDSPAPIRFTPAKSYNRVAQLADTYAGFLDGQSTSASTAADAAEEPPALTSANQYDLELVQVESDRGSIGYYIALAFVGGLILNLMPCVLPVIGLKVMSFVEQAGKSRSHALVLNLWFAAGIIFVFLILGALAATLGLGWGGQFGSTTFNVILASVVFAMALSLLGVWEVPIPGFFGSGSVHKVATQEGPLGAFLKGVVTTVLATPCTAPFMAAAVAWAVAQSLATSLAVFATLGLGMASPYLLIGVYPELLRFLPKPGAWMETFKQISGFILLATVVFILSFITPGAIIPTIALLLGIGVACWLVGRMPAAAERWQFWRTWAAAAAVIVLFAGISFGWLYQDVMRPRYAFAADSGAIAAEADWQPFSLERLKQLTVDSGKTVLVDFSAEWCLTCKALELAVLHTEPVEQAIRNSDVVTMYADYTDYPPEIARTIRALNASGVPVIAVFPGNAPYHPIVFRGSYTQQGIIEALEEATGRRLQSASGTSVADAGNVASPVN